MQATISDGSGIATVRQHTLDDLIQRQYQDTYDRAWIGLDREQDLLRMVMVVHEQCTRCGQEVDMTGPAKVPFREGRARPVRTQHGCGEWNSPYEETVDVGDWLHGDARDDEDLAGEAEDLIETGLAQVRARVAEVRAAREDRLRCRAQDIARQVRALLPGLIAEHWQAGDDEDGARLAEVIVDRMYLAAGALVTTDIVLWLSAGDDDIEIIVVEVTPGADPADPTGWTVAAWYYEQMEEPTDEDAYRSPEMLKVEA